MQESLKQSLYNVLSNLIENSPKLKAKYDEYNSDEEIYIFIKDLLDLPNDERVSDLSIEECLWLLNESIYELSYGSISIEDVISDKNQKQIYEIITQYENRK